MASLKEYCEQNGLVFENTINLMVGKDAGAGVLPTPTGFTGYTVEITDSALVFYNDKQNIHGKAFPFSDFQRAEFGIGGGNLWLQCVVANEILVFCVPRKVWKGDTAKKLIEKIDAVTPILDKKEFDRYTGKLFFLYMFK